MTDLGTQMKEIKQELACLYGLLVMGCSRERRCLERLKALNAGISSIDENCFGDTVISKDDGDYFVVRFFEDVGLRTMHFNQFVSFMMTDKIKSQDIDSVCMSANADEGGYMNLCRIGTFHELELPSGFSF